MKIGDIVQWSTYFGKEKGEIVDINGNMVTVEYSPWCDRFNAPIDKLELVKNEIYIS